MIESMVRRVIEKGPAYWLEAVNNLSTSFNLTSRDTDLVLGLILRRLVKELGAHALAVWTVEENSNFMKIEASAGLHPEFIRYFNKTDRLKAGKGVIGKVMLERKTFHTVNIGKTNKLTVPRWQKFLTDEGINAFIAAPMFIGKKIIGAFVIYYQHSPRSLAKNQIKFIEIIANQTAVTLENIKNYQTITQYSQRLLQQVKHILELQKVTGRLSISAYQSAEKPVELFFQYLQERFRIGAIAVLEPDESNQLLRVTASFGFSEEHHEFLAQSKFPLESIHESSSLSALAFIEGEIKISSRAFTDERIAKRWRIFLSTEGKSALAAFPMIVGEERVGVVTVFYNTVHDFHEEEISILDVMAKYLGISLLNLKFFGTIIAEREQMASMINSLYDGLIVYDLEGRITSFNPRAEELLGVSAAETSGRVIEDLDENKNINLRNVKVISTLELADLESREITIIIPAEKILVITSVPLRGKKKLRVGSMRILHDVTRETEIEKLRRNFVTIASHQLRTPLTSIRWMVDGMLRGNFGAINPTQKHYLDNGFKATSRLFSMINDLLLVSRIDTEGFEYDVSAFNIYDLIREVVGEISSTLPPNEKKIEFIIEDRPEIVPEIISDRKRLKIALVNIIGNAAIYTREGSVTVGVRFEGVMKKSIIVYIKDTGIGIPKQAQQYLFTKFFRAVNAITLHPDGSGLGLFIVKEIVKRLNGKIWAESEEGKGSTFYIMLPLELTLKK